MPTCVWCDTPPGRRRRWQKRYDRKDSISKTTQQSYKYTLATLKEKIGDRPVNTIKAMDIEDLLRDLRREGKSDSYVSQMQALGVDLATIQSMVGHADLDMTQHYLHVQSPIKQKAVEAFNAAFCGNKPHSSQIPVDPKLAELLSKKNPRFLAKSRFFGPSD